MNRDTRRIELGVTRRRLLSGAVATLASSALPRGEAARNPAPSDPEIAGRELLVRTITAGVRLSATGFETELTGATRFLDRARRIMDEQGYPVQTLRIVTQPHVDYLGPLPAAEVVRVVQAMKDQLGGNYGLGIGHGNVGDEAAPQAIDKAVAIARLGVSSSLLVGTAGTVHPRVIPIAADAVRAIASDDVKSSFNFAAVAEVPPGIPFFPAGYLGGERDTFTIGTQSAGLFARVCRAEPDRRQAEQSLVDAYSRALQGVERAAIDIADRTGWHYGGIDPTPAPWGEASIGAAIEALTNAPFGAPGTLAACRLLTRVVRAMPVRRVGYQGLFLPPMEDAVLAARAFDYFGLNDLLAFSSVCGTGLDTVAIPGAISREAVARIVLDIASLAVHLSKPLTARLVPVPGKHAGEDSGVIGKLQSMKVLAAE